MVPNPDAIETLENCASFPWRGTVFRHMFAKFPPDRENVRGARWNPPETPALYTSLLRETAISEADYYIGLQPIRPSAQRVIYRIDVALGSVLDLSDGSALSRLGIDITSLALVDHADCQLIGGAVERIGHDGLLVPSARSEGVNLVIFPNRKKPDYRFEVLDSEKLPPST